MDLTLDCPITMKVIGRHTRQHDTEVLEKFYDDLVPDLPHVPYVDEASAQATVEGMQAPGPPLLKVDPQTIVY
jgi:hypothetical protein